MGLEPRGEEHGQGILLKPLPPLEGGKAVDERAYREIAEELEELARKMLLLSIVLTEFLKIAGARIGEKAARARI